MAYLNWSTNLLIGSCIFVAIQVVQSLFIWQSVVFSLFHLCNVILFLLIILIVRAFDLNALCRQIGRLIERCIFNYYENCTVGQDIARDCHDADQQHEVEEEARKIREQFLEEFIFSWWTKLCNSSSFDSEFITSQRQIFTKLGELLAVRLHQADISSRTVDAILVKVLLKKRSQPTKSTETFDMDAASTYFNSASQKILKFVFSTLNTAEVANHNNEILINLLAEILSSSALMPLFELLSDPRIFYNLWLGIVVQDMTVREFLTKISQTDANLNCDDATDANTLIRRLSQRRVSTRNSSLTAELRDAEVDDPIEEDLTKKVKINAGEVSLPVIKNLSISSTRNAVEQGSKNQYTLYCVAYFMRGSLTVASRWQHYQVERRYREFVNLHKSLQSHPSYKGVRGPSIFRTVLQINLSQELINQRKSFLEQYLSSLVSRRELLSTLQLKTFLAIDGGGRFSYEVESTPWDTKIFSKITSIVDKITPNKSIFHSDSAANLKNDQSSNSTDSESTKPTASDVAEADFKKHLPNLPSIPHHRMPLLPEFNLCEEPYAHHPFLEDNLLFLRHQFKSRFLYKRHSSVCHYDVETSPQIYASIRSHQPPKLVRPAPFLLAFRLLALQYRPNTEDWRPDVGPFLLRVKPDSIHRLAEITFRALGYLADPIITFYYESLFVPSAIASYIKAIRLLLWPEIGQPPSDLCTELPIETLQLGARIGLIDILPDITYLFVDRVHLGIVVDRLLKDIEDVNTTREFIFTLFQIVLESLFPEIIEIDES